MAASIVVMQDQLPRFPHYACYMMVRHGRRRAVLVETLQSGRAYMLKRPTTYLLSLLLPLAAYFLLGGTAADPSVEERLWRHRNLGKALFETPATEAESVAELKKALDLAPDSTRDRLNYGLALLRSGNTKDAIVELEKVQKQDPSLPHTWFNLGIAFKRETRHEEAIRQFTRMVELVPDEPI